MVMFESLVGLFALGTLGFWVLVAAVSVLLMVCVAYEKPVFASLMLIATFLLLGWLGDFNAIAAAKAHPLVAALAVAGYFVAGTAWAFGKWWFFLKSGRAEYDESRRDFLKANGLDPAGRIPDHLLRAWSDRAHQGRLGWLDRSADGGRIVAPKARDHKGRIMIWMTYWPWSFVWTMIDDPIKKIFKAIYRSLQATFQKMSDRVFAGVDEDFRAPPPPPAPPADNDEPDRSVRSSTSRRTY